MGWLGLCLLFVGIALISNGVAAIIQLDGKSTAFINLVTGLVIVAGNFIALGRLDFEGTAAAYNGAAAGFLFGFTYLFIAAIYLLGLDPRAFGWYSLCVAVFASVSAVVSFGGGALPMGVLWTAWAILWLEGFLQLAAGCTPLKKIFPALSILEGVFAAGLPALMMLFGTWPA
jgi:acid-activated urea channel